jgi:hypothetical protein
MMGVVGCSVLGSIGADGATTFGLLLLGRSLDVKKVGRGWWCVRCFFEREECF